MFNNMSTTSIVGPDSSSGGGRLNEDVIYDTMKRWKGRAEQWEAFHKEMKQWETQSLVGVSRAEALMTPLRMNQYFAGSHLFSSADDSVCELCTTRKQYNNDIRELEAFLEERNAAEAETKNDLQNEEEDLRIEDEMDLSGFCEIDETIMTQQQREGLKRLRQCLLEERRKRIKLQEESRATREATRKFGEEAMQYRAERMKYREEKLKLHVSSGASSLYGVCRSSESRVNFTYTVLSTMQILSRGHVRAAVSPSKIPSSFVLALPPGMFPHCADFDPNPPRTASSLHCSPCITASLRDFQSQLERHFKMKTPDPAGCLNESVTNILEWKRNKKSSPPNSNVRSNAPQSILYAILFTTAFIQKGTRKKATEADDVMKQSVKHVVGRVSNHLREADIFDVVVPLTALQKKGTQFPMLHNNCVLAAVNEMAAILTHALQFGGVGVDCTARAAVISMVSVEILELELKFTWTQCRRILLRRTGNLPLFGEETTNGLFDNKMAFQQIFQTDANKSNGFEVLAGLMSNVEPSFSFSNGHIRYKDSDSELELVKYMRTGSFHRVYELKAPGSILKVPKDCDGLSILHDEMRALHKLNDERIPKAANEMGVLAIQLRCETSTLKCLKMECFAGPCASAFYFTNCEEIELVGREVSRALDHAHGHHIAHMSVQPCYIIVSKRNFGMGSDLELQIQLVNWELASSFEETLTGVCGNAYYGHDDMLHPSTRDEWQPAPRHDFASLAYTLAAIVLNMGTDSFVIPWERYDGYDEQLEARNQMTESYLSKLRLEPCLFDKLRAGGMYGRQV